MEHLIDGLSNILRFYLVVTERVVCRRYRVHPGHLVLLQQSELCQQRVLQEEWPITVVASWGARVAIYHLGS